MSTARFYLTSPSPKAAPVPVDLRSEHFALLRSGKKFPDAGINRYLIIGFDTEYQSSLADRNLDHELLSYQFSCEIVSLSEEHVSWSGIVLPFGPRVQDRLSVKEFIEFAISEGVRLHPDLLIPRDIYLIAHFTRADIPGFRDFKEGKLERDLLQLQNVRNTFVNVKKDVPLKLRNTVSGADEIAVSVKIRDTIHLAPQGAKSLKDLGELLGFPKIDLATTDAESIEIKRNMKRLMSGDWALFREYAIRDAEVCSRYAVEIIKEYENLTGDFKLPLTLTSIGVDLLQKFWRDQGINPLEIIGKEEVRDGYFNKRLGRYVQSKRVVYKQKLHWHIDFITECYHGGRNEQFWFGPCYQGVWYDYDLQSAYPSAMSLIGIPDWDSIRTLRSLDDLLSLSPVDLAYANVNFEFDASVRYPCLPVRTENGIIFPRRGNCSTHISEILLAHRLGCKIELVEGRYVPSKRHPKGNRVFQGFLEHCIAKRSQYAKKTAMNLFWKEIANSTYGKTAQGLRRRRVYNLKDEQMDDLEESKITNPFYAAFITGFCRATLSEIMNNLPDDKTVFSVTTDGFLTDAGEQDIIDATTGTLSRYYKDARHKLVASELIYEVKHCIRQPLGWRTRGQATLIPGEPTDHPDQSPKEDDLTVLAKGGIKLPDKLSKPEENLKIVEMFFNRQGGQMIPMVLGLGIKDMYLEGRDFVDKAIIKRLSMEFDWKRKPLFVGEAPVPQHDSHLFFSTEPWDSFDQFAKIRDIWAEYQSTEFRCLKSFGDYKDFSAYVESKLSLDQVAQRYLKKKDGDLIRLRRDIITAWRHRKAGTHVLKPHCFGLVKIFPDYRLKAKEFAEILDSKVGIPCSKGDVDNGVKIDAFVPHQVPNNERTRSKLLILKDRMFPKLEIDSFLSHEAVWNIESADLHSCPSSQKMLFDK